MLLGSIQVAKIKGDSPLSSLSYLLNTANRLIAHEFFWPGNFGYMQAELSAECAKFTSERS